MRTRGGGSSRSSVSSRVRRSNSWSARSCDRILRSTWRDVGVGAKKDRRRLLFAGIALALAAGAAAAGVLLVHGGTSSSRAQSRAAPDSVALVSAGDGGSRRSGGRRPGPGALALRRRRALERHAHGAADEDRSGYRRGPGVSQHRCPGPVRARRRGGVGLGHRLQLAHPGADRPCPSRDRRADRAAEGPRHLRDGHGRSRGRRRLGLGRPGLCESELGRAARSRGPDACRSTSSSRKVAPRDSPSATAHSGSRGDVDVPGPPKLSRIDPVTNKVTPALANFRGAFCCIAVGGGFVWGATSGDHRIWKIAEDGTVGSYIQLPADAQDLTYCRRRRVGG